MVILTKNDVWNNETTRNFAKQTYGWRNKRNLSTKINRLKSNFMKTHPSPKSSNIALAQYTVPRRQMVFVEQIDLEFDTLPNSYVDSLWPRVMSAVWAMFEITLQMFASACKLSERNWIFDKNEQNFRFFLSLLVMLDCG